MRNNTTWRIELTKAFAEQGDVFASDSTECTLTREQLDTEFYPGFGGEEGAPFTAWSATRVYFPACYDGSEWVASAPRNPCNEATYHVGGG